MGNGELRIQNEVNGMIWRSVFACLALLFCFAASRAQESVPLWPSGRMPNSRGMVLKEIEENQRITQVGTPRMEIFLPASEDSRHCAVIIIPGGGYHHLTRVWAGHQLAKWFNTMGVSAFVLLHRLPTSPDLVQREIGPLQDAQRAIRIVRASAAKWGVERDKIGVIGTSAGGHLAALVGIHEEDVSAIGDSLNAVPYRPNFMILVSPVIDLGSYAHVGSRENLLGKEASSELIAKYSCQNCVTASAPPCFIVHAANDKAVPIQNSMLFHKALVDKGGMASLHIFPYGGHTIALRNNPGSTAYWTLLTEAWLKEMGIIADPEAKK
jgi:acetyl esterase/lipase